MKKLRNSNDIEKGIKNSNSSSSISTSFESSESSGFLYEESEIQPSNHENKKSCCESLLKILLKRNYDLNKLEYRKYNDLRKECFVLFDEHNTNHEKLLKDLFETFLEINCLKNIEKNHLNWKRLGFQSENPRTDFRAGGLYSLKFMHFFSWKYSNEFYQTLNLEYFLFAVVCIRLTYMLKLFLNLVKDEDLEISLRTNKCISCSRRQLKNFCYYLSHNENFMIYSLSKLLIFVIRKFEQELDTNKKELNFLLIDPLLKKSIANFAKFLDKTVSLDDYDSILDSNM